MHYSKHYESFIRIRGLVSRLVSNRIERRNTPMTRAKVVHRVSSSWRKMWGRKLRVERALCPRLA